MKDNSNGENIGAFDEYVKAYDKSMEIFGGAKDDFHIDTLEVE